MVPFRPPPEPESPSPPPPPAPAPPPRNVSYSRVADVVGRIQSKPMSRSPSKPGPYSLSKIKREVRDAEDDYADFSDMGEQVSI